MGKCNKSEHKKLSGYNYCPSCVIDDLEKVKCFVNDLLVDWEVSIVAKGSNVVVRAKTGEEVYL